MSHEQVKIFSVKLIFDWICWVNWNQNIFQKRISFSDFAMHQAVLYLTEILSFILLHLGYNNLLPAVQFLTWHFSYFQWHPPLRTNHGAISFQCLAPSEWGRAVWLPGLQGANDASTQDTSCASFHISLPLKEGGVVLPQCTWIHSGRQPGSFLGWAMRIQKGSVSTGKSPDVSRQITCCCFTVRGIKSLV